VIALVGYTNAGKSTLLNRLCKAGVLAENMLFATLDPTTRKVALPRTNKKPDEEKGRHSKGQEVLLTDTVGFISKLPTDLIAAFRATLEEVQNADVLIHVCDRSSPVWKKQRETVLRELDSIGCYKTPIVELWNKIDALPDCEDIMLEAATLPIDVEGGIEDADGIDGSKPSSDDLSLSRVASELAPELTDADDMALSGDVDSIETFASPQATASIDGVRSTHRADRRIFTVAASALTGVGFDDFLATLEDALSLLLKSIDVFIPYDKDDGIIARIFSQGSVDEIEYKNSGTRLVCRVPESLFTRLRPFQIKT
jgi:50S ribosomal subunit-associated GTPase HflX